MEENRGTDWKNFFNHCIDGDYIDHTTFNQQVSEKDSVDYRNYHIHILINGDDKESKLQELLTEVERLNQLNTANAYKTTRRTKYPTVTDQLDMLWHAIDTGTLDKSSDFYTTLKSVKNNYPKPE